MTDSSSSIPIILLAFANHADTPLRELANEQDELTEALHQVQDTGAGQVFTIAAASPEKIIKIFQRYQHRIRIFHYGGHSSEEALLLQKDFPDQESTKAAYLAEFLGVQENLELVFINGCLSSGQAAAYHQEGAKTVITTDKAIGDIAAREFARYFYQALAGGSTISEAFQSAETGYKVKHGGLPRAQGFQPAKHDAAWTIYPEGPHQWRLPSAKRNTDAMGPRFVTHRRAARQDKLLQRHLVLSDIQLALKEHKVLWLHGPSGCGKTVLAEQYYHLFLPEYQHVAWIEVKHDFLQDFIAAAPLEVPILEIRARLEQLDRPRPDIDRACARAFSQYLANLPGQVLLMVDGIKDLQHFTPYYELLELHQNHVLITSLKIPAPEHDWSRRYHCHEFAAPPFTNEEIHLLAARYTREYTWASELMDRLRYNVYLSSILFKNLDRTQPSLLDEQLRSLLRQAPTASVDQSLLTLLFRQFQPTREECWLLLQWAALPEGFYEVDFVAHLIGLEDAEQLVSTQAYRNFKGKEKSRRLFWSRKSKDRPFLELLEQLLKHGWLVANEEDHVSLHSAVVPVLRSELSPRLDFFVELSENLQEVFFLHEEIGVEDTEAVEMDDRFWMRSNVQYENHLRSLVDLIQEEASEEFLGLLNKLIGIFEANLKLTEELKLREQYVSILKNREGGNSLHLAATLNDLAECFKRNGRYKEALGYHQRALAIGESMLEANHSHLAIFYNNIGLIYRDLGQYQEALGYHQKALAIKESVLDTNHLDLANSYNNIGLTYRDLGQYKEALGYHQKAQAILELVLEANHPYLASSYNNIGLTYRDLGQYKEALGYHQKAQAIGESVLEANHPDLANSYNDIANTYRDLGQYQEALSYHQKAQAIRESVLDTNHPYLASSYNNIGLTYHNLGQYQEALSYNQKALAIRESVLEANHPDLASSYNDIGLTYRDLGQYQEALSYHQKAQAIWESVLDTNHPYLASSYNNIGLTYRDLGQYEEALGYHQKAQAIFESVLEANHPELANSYNNFGLIYQAMGEYKQALGYHQKAQAIWESVLETNHPYLASSYHNIAGTYRDLGRYEEALSYDQKAQAIWESVLDTNHPYLANSYNNIAGTYRDLGQHEQALGYHQKAQAILESALDANHPNLAFSYHNIAKIYRALGQYEQALSYHQKAQSIFESVLDASHPHLAIFYNNFAATYRALGQNNKADAYEAKAAAISKKRKE